MSRNRGFRRFLRILKGPWTFQVAATALFVGLVVWQIDLQQVGDSLRAANYGWAALALAANLVTKAVDTLRWQVYLSKVGQAPFLGLLGAFLIGNLLNNLLPMRAGDVARIQIVANRYGLSRAGLASSVFVVEALLDGVTFLVLLMVGLAVLDLGFVPPALLWSVAAASGGGFVAAVMASALLPRQAPRWRWLARLPAWARSGLEEGWPRFLDGLETMRNWRMLLAAMLLNFVGWGSQVITFALFGLAFGLDVPLVAFIVIMIAANLVSAFPITFENIGTYEAVLLGVLAAWDVPGEQALAYAIVTHLLTNLWVIGLGMVALWLMRLRPRDLFSLVRQGRPAALPSPPG
ncbi:hypothetical protein HRbin24_01643 [bacterium HR24]|nr:hypothetical protein HRbin24_01643 [bacterium HR24]